MTIKGYTWNKKVQKLAKKVGDIIRKHKEEDI